MAAAAGRPGRSAFSAGNAQGPARNIAIEEKGKRVMSWLRKIYCNEPIPKYEVSERTVNILYGLTEINEARDRDVSLLIKDMEHQAREYKQKANYLRGILEDCLGLSTYSLPSKINNYLSFLVDSALILETKDTSLASLFCAINDMTAELYATESRNREMEMELRHMHKKLSAALVLEERLRTDLEKTELLLERERFKSDRRFPQFKFLRAKSYEIKISIQLAEEQLLAQGWDRSLTHESLLSLSETLAKLQEDNALLKQELQNYQDLTPNPFLARVRIEEVRRELNALEEEFLKYVTVLSIEMQDPSRRY